MLTVFLVSLLLLVVFCVLIAADKSNNYGKPTGFSKFCAVFIVLPSFLVALGSAIGLIIKYTWGI